MKVLITGHRLHKLQTYNTGWIHDAIGETLEELKYTHGYIRGYAGMASGVDLWFCQHCLSLAIQYVACIPFDTQDETMDEHSKKLRSYMLEGATEKKHVKNSWMVEECDMAIVVWDGNKGGTHNVVQQLIEKKKSFIWINPVAQVVWNCMV